MQTHWWGVNSSFWPQLPTSLSTKQWPVRVSSRSGAQSDRLISIRSFICILIATWTARVLLTPLPTICNSSSPGLIYSCLSFRHPWVWLATSPERVGKQSANLKIVCVSIRMSNLFASDSSWWMAPVFEQSIWSAFEWCRKAKELRLPQQAELEASLGALLTPIKANNTGLEFQARYSAWIRFLRFLD